MLKLDMERAIMRVLITGSAGFIGSALALALLRGGHAVCGIDAFTPYYDVRLKEARNARLGHEEGFALHRLNIEDFEALGAVFEAFRPHRVVHLAAQVGVRYSLQNPRAYIDTNITGTFNILELCRAGGVEHALLASTSSAYGASRDFPFRETACANHPLTVYAASKRAGELLGHSTAHLYHLPVTMMRFFSVYGPWGRPDMAPFLFVDRISRGQPIDVYNHGDVARDFTYIDDIVRAITLLMQTPPEPGKPVCASDSLSPVAPHRTVNIGHGTPVPLMDFIAAIEAATGRRASMHMMDMQPGDAHTTLADTTLLKALTGFAPKTGIEQGVKALADWYKDYSPAS